MIQANGPWKDIFRGVWGGYDITLAENPDRITHLQITDQKDGEVRGIISILNKYFLADSNPSMLAERLDYSLIFEKNTPNFKASYISITTGPVYSKPEEVDRIVLEEMAKIEKLAEDLNAAAGEFRIDVTDMKNAEDEKWEKLFAEPIILPSLMLSKKAEKKKLGLSLIGTKITGEVAEESTESFLKTIVTGPNELRGDLVKVIVENCILNGVSAVVFDETDAFTNMGMPNKNFDSKNYPNLQPIGMPIKTVKPGEVKINLNMLTPDMFREITGIERKSAEYYGKTASELLDEVLEKSTGEFKEIDDFEEKLMSITVESKKFHIYRAVRFMKVIKNAYKDQFSGKTDTDVLVSNYMRSMGSVSRLDVKDLPNSMRRAFVYTVIRSLNEKYKVEQPGFNVINVLINAADYAPSDAKTALQKGILEELGKSPDYGVGYCIAADNEQAVYKDAVKTATMDIEFINRQEIAIKPDNEKAYRAKIRSRLSA